MDNPSPTETPIDDELRPVPFLGEVRAMYLGQTRPRAVALCLFWRGGDLLVQEFWHPGGTTAYYRPIGGSIEYGEWSADAARREVREELHTEITDLRHLVTLENIFKFAGATGHEIVFIYEATFVDPSLYERAWLEGEEADGDPFKLFWKPLTAFHPDHAPLYPTALYDLLKKR